MEKFFKIKERGSTLKTEIFAGITTFFAMAYIIFVNPNQVAAEGANGWLVGLGADPGTMGQIWNSVYIASIIVAIIGTLLMAFVADMPFAQACGMGLNSFFCTIFVAGSFFAGEDVKTSQRHKGHERGLQKIRSASSLRQRSRSLSEVSPREPAPHGLGGRYVL